MNEHLEEWRRGNEATLSSIKRLLEHQQWLKQQHKEVKDKILQRKKEDEDEEQPPVQGFPKD